MYSYLNSKVKKIRSRNIKIDINEFSSYKKKLTEKVKEKSISNIIDNFKHEMDTISYNVIKNLAEILILYNEFEYFYEYLEPMTENDLKTLNERLNQVDFIPKKIKAKIIRDKIELLKVMQRPGYEISPREHLTFYRKIIMNYFLQDENLKKSLSAMKYVYIKKNNRFVKRQTYRDRNLKRGNYFQQIVNQILEFYFHNKIFYENKRKITIAIIGYENNIPVLNPKFFKIKKERYLIEILFRTRL